MTDTALKNPIVTAVLAVKNGEDVAALGSATPLTVQSANADPIDRSSSITTGGVAQVAMEALSTRKAYFFQNVSQT